MTDIYRINLRAGALQVNLQSPVVRINLGDDGPTVITPGDPLRVVVNDTAIKINLPVSITVLGAMAWTAYAVTSWTEIDGSFYADVTHTAGKQFVPFQIFRTDTGETYDPEKAWCSAVNTISLQMPFEINLTVLVGA